MNWGGMTHTGGKEYSLNSFLVQTHIDSLMWRGREKEREREKEEAHGRITAQSPDCDKKIPLLAPRLTIIVLGKMSQNLKKFWDLFAIAEEEEKEGEEERGGRKKEERTKEGRRKDEERRQKKGWAGWFWKVATVQPHVQKLIHLTFEKKRKKDVRFLNLFYYIISQTNTVRHVSCWNHIKIWFRHPV